MINLKTIKDNIAGYALKYARKADDITLLAVSKGQTVEKIKAAWAQGQRRFGENYLQEALAKKTALSEFDIEWYFIGAIQQNKAKKITENFDWVLSLDNLKVAAKLNQYRPSHKSPLNVCLQINISAETTKSGIAAEEAEAFCNQLQQFSHLKLRGLMAIPASESKFEDQRQTFSKLRQLFFKLNEKGFKLDTLSMGMSDDMEAAIAEGCTLLRIGRAIFGERK